MTQLFHELNVMLTEYLFFIYVASFYISAFCKIVVYMKKQF